MWFGVEGGEVESGKHLIVEVRREGYVDYYRESYMLVPHETRGEKNENKRKWQEKKIIEQWKWNKKKKKRGGAEN